MATVPGLSIYQEADRQQTESDWQAKLAAEGGVQGIRQDTSSMGSDIAGVISLTQGITPEGRRITYDQAPPEVRSAADQIVKGVTGSTIDELRAAFDDPNKILTVAKAIDPMGNISESLMQERLQAAGVPVAEATKAASLASMVLSAFYQPVGKAGKTPLIGERLSATAGPQAAQATPEAARAVGPAAGILGAGAAAGLAASQMGQPPQAEAAPSWNVNPKKIVERLKQVLSTPGESRINVGRVSATRSVKQMMQDINRAEAAGLEASRQAVPHAAVVESAKQIPIQEVLKADLEKFDSAALRTAARGFNVGATRRTERLMKAAAKGDEKAAVDLLAAYALAGQLSFIQERLGTIQARALAAGRIVVPGNLSTKGMSRLYAEMRQKAEEASAGAALAPMGPAGQPTHRVIAGELLEGLSALRGEPDVTRIVDALTLELGDGDPVKAGLALARKLRTLTPDQQAKAALQSTSLIHKIGRGFYSAWIETLLSGPQTHAANMISNALTAAMAPPERFIAAMTDGWFKEREIFFGESTAMAMGMLRVWKRASVAAWQTVRTGESSFGPSKVAEMASRINPKLALKGEAASAHTSAVEHLKMVLPTRWMTAEDELWKIMNLAGEFDALALREGRIRGLSGGAFAEFVAKVKQNPQDYPDIVEKAQVAALERTFNGPTKGVIGAFADAAMGIRTKYPVLGVIVPFIRTPANLLQFATERTPGLNLLSTQLWSELRAGGASAALARGKLGMSGMIAGSFAMYASTPVPRGHWFNRGMKNIPEGQPIPYMTMITGAGPADPEMRRMLETELGWKPYSIWHDGQYVTYQRIDPWGTVLGLIADTAEVYGNAPENDLATLSGAIVLALSKYTEEKTFMQGAAQIFATLDGLKQGRAGAASAWARGVAGSVVPAFVAQTNKELFDRHMHEARTIVDAVRARNWNFVPGVKGSETVQRRYNLFGLPQMYSHGYVPFKGTEGNDSDTPGIISIAADLLSPVKAASSRRDENAPEFKAAVEIAKLRMTIQPTPPQIGGTQDDPLGLRNPTHYPGIPLKAEERETWTLLAANYRVGGKNLAEGIVDLIGRASYVTAPPNVKSAQINLLINNYRAAAQPELLKKFPDLKDKVDQLRGLNTDLQKRVTDPRSPFQGETDSGQQIRMQGTTIRGMKELLR